MTAPDLLPCPFCGGDADLEFADFGDPAWQYLSCRRCCTTSGASSTAELAIAAWNRRAPTPLAAALALPEVQRLLEKAYLAGMLASAEGYNGEYPGGGFEEDDMWLGDRDTTIAALKGGAE